MKCSCGYVKECGIWCGNGHRNGSCPPYLANNDVTEPPHPHCDYCGDCAPFGDERNLWIDYHQSWFHKVYWNIRNKYVR